MLETIYHRVQKPWTFPMPKGKVGVVIRIGKKLVGKIELVFGDPMGGWEKAGWVNFKKDMELVCETSEHEIYEVNMFIPTKRYRYAFKISPKNGKAFLWGESGVLNGEEEIKEWAKGFTYSYWNEVDFLKTPDWFRKTSWYQIFPDRFARVGNCSKNLASWNKKPKGHELYGGNIKGIINKLEHIKSLGFNGIYLNPIFEAKTAHRYETKDYYNIDNILGNEEEFQDLISKAHKLGIKVMLDGVFNHIGYHSKQFQDVIKNKEKSKYKDWFWINNFNNIKQPSEYEKGEFQKDYPYETFAIVPEMPRLNWENKEVRSYLMGAAEKWTRMGIDGWRLDVSFEPPIKFWREFSEKVKGVNKDIVIIGEVWWDSITFLESDIWHGIMNYPIRRIILDYVMSKQTLKNKEKFVYQFNKLAYTYTPEQQWGMFNLMSSHDVERLITLLENDENKYKMAMELCFLQPGAPSTYYGQEIGLEGGFDPDNRRAYPWHLNSKKYFSFFQELNKKRNSFVEESDIFSRFIAKLINDEIILENSTNKIIVNKRVEMKGK